MEINSLVEELNDKITSAQNTIQILQDTINTQAEEISTLKTSVNNANKFYAPNYSSYTSYTAGTTYTIPSDGYLFTHILRSNTGEGNLTLTINGKALQAMASNDYSHDYCLFPIKKGDTVSFTTSNLSVGTVYFYSARS